MWLTDPYKLRQRGVSMADPTDEPEDRAFAPGWFREGSGEDWNRIWR
jgi:hypothetical protein